MTKKQYQLCKTIFRYKTLGAITRIVDVDYLTLQQELNNQLNFSDGEIDDDTVVTLKNSLQNDYESYRSDMIRSNLSMALSAIAAIAAITSTVLQIIRR